MQIEWKKCECVCVEILEKPRFAHWLKFDHLTSIRHRICLLLASVFNQIFCFCVYLFWYHYHIQTLQFLRSNALQYELSEMCSKPRFSTKIWSGFCKRYNGTYRSESYVDYVWQQIRHPHIRNKRENRRRRRIQIWCALPCSENSIFTLYLCISVYTASERENPAAELIYLSLSFDQFRSVSLAFFIRAHWLAHSSLLLSFRKLTVYE